MLFRNLQATGAYIGLVGKCFVPVDPPIFMLQFTTLARILILG